MLSTQYAPLASKHTALQKGPAQAFPQADALAHASSQRTAEQTPEQATERAKQGKTSASAPQFAGGISYTPNTVGNALKHIDFKELAQSHISQIQIIYSACILWRLAAAYYRSEKSATKSRNEIRESIVRDGAGFSFWFFATPIMQRLFLKSKLVPEEFRDALVQKTPEPAQKGLSHLNWSINPLAKYTIPSSRQVENQKEQALQALKKAGIQVESKAYEKVLHYYQGLTKYRNYATGLGIGMTIAMIGIGINALNIYMTRNNVNKRQINPVPPTPSPTPASTFTPPSPSTAFTAPRLTPNPIQAAASAQAFIPVGLGPNPQPAPPNVQ